MKIILVIPFLLIGCSTPVKDTDSILEILDEHGYRASQITIHNKRNKSRISVTIEKD